MVFFDERISGMKFRGNILERKAFTNPHNVFLNENFSPPMKTYYPPADSSLSQPTLPLKASIRDMMQVQQQYNLPDELFWEIFNARVLLNQEIDVISYVQGRNRPSA